MNYLLFLFSSFFMMNQPILREGSHALTYQMISWEDPGRVMIKKLSDGTFSIVGEQKGKDKSDYLKIKGKLKIVNARELIFNGEILTKVEGVNNGMECKRSGKYHFNARGKRKYFRLQEMINCEGGMVTDYIDIYF